VYLAALLTAQLGIITTKHQARESQPVPRSSLFEQRLQSLAGTNQCALEEFTLNETNPLEGCDQLISWDLRKSYYYLLR